MCKVYLYSRVSTSAQTLAQQERTVYEWLNNHNMTVGEIISDEGVSGGVSYKDRNLGKILLPMLVEGDMLIVSEISRLGRSMFDLSKLIHTELKPRKVRLVVCNMGIDLNCSKMTAIDELILNNFSFAAQLEKQLISERTLSALQVKKAKGVKLGAASETYKSNQAKKSPKEIDMICKARGASRTKKFLDSPDSQAFLKVIKNVFPDHCVEENPKNWEWIGIRARLKYTEQIIKFMRDYKDVSGGQLFGRWDFDSPLLVRRLRAYLQNFKKAIQK